MSMLHVTSRIISCQCDQMGRFVRILAKNLPGGPIHTGDVAVWVEGQNAGRNVFEDGFDKGTAAVEFLNCLLEVLSEFVDASMAIGQLRSHPIEGPNQGSQFVLSPHIYLRPQVAGRDFTGGLGQGLDRHRNLLS